MNRRIYVEPTKTIGGIPFGSQKKKVERDFNDIFGYQLESTQVDNKEAVIYENAIIYYENDNFIGATLIPDNNFRVIVNSVNVNSDNERSVMNDLRMMYNPDTDRGIKYHNESVGCIDFFQPAKVISNDIITESVDVMIEKSKIGNFIKNTAKKAADTASSAGKKAGNFVKSTTKNIGDKSKEAAQKVGRAAKKVPVWMKNKSSKKNKEDNPLKETIKDMRKDHLAVSVDEWEKKAREDNKKYTEAEDLLSFYDKLNSDVVNDPNPVNDMPSHHHGHRDLKMFKLDLHKKSNDLKDQCCHHILCDVYIHTNPFDKSFVDNNTNILKQDVDNMLASKGMNATQYITSCGEKTEAPLIKYLLMGIDGICEYYEMIETAKFKKFQEAGIDYVLEEPNIETNENLNSQLVDLKDDAEYNTFMNRLHAKTQQKIIEDVSDLINSKKKEDDMKFEPKNEEEPQTESVYSICRDYISEKILFENADVDIDISEQLDALVFREMALNEIDKCMQGEPINEIKQFNTMINMGNGRVVNDIYIYELIQ